MKNTADKYDKHGMEIRKTQPGNMKNLEKKYEKHSKEICQACSGHLGA